MGIDVAAMRVAASELKKGERTLMLCGSFHMNQGFTIFPVKNGETEIYLQEDSISRIITQEEAIELSKHEHCTNKEAAEAMLREVGAIE